MQLTVALVWPMLMDLIKKVMITINDQKSGEAPESVDKEDTESGSSAIKGC